MVYIYRIHINIVSIKCISTHVYMYVSMKAVGTWFFYDQSVSFLQILFCDACSFGKPWEFLGANRLLSNQSPRNNEQSWLFELWKTLFLKKLEQIHGSTCLLKMRLWRIRIKSCGIELSKRFLEPEISSSINSKTSARRAQCCLNIANQKGR